MNIEQPKHVLSSSTSEDLPADVLPFELNHIDLFNSAPITNDRSIELSTLLNDQLRLERQIADESSIITEQSFVNTYSSLQTMFSQMQIKLASVFLQEIEYLQVREAELQSHENNLTKHQEQIRQVDNQRRQLEDEFSHLQDRVNLAIDHISQFYSDGERILQMLFSESRQIDADLSALICECLGSLARCRTMIDERIDNFSQKTNRIQSNIIDQQTRIRYTQLSISLMLDLVNQLNEQNVQHSNELTLTMKRVDNKTQVFHHQSETTKMHWNIQKELNEIRTLEQQKCQLRKELFEQTMMLQNINTVIGKAIIN